MQAAAESRPHRSRGQVACLPCRQRKSRCTIERASSQCLMCRVHGTECSFPMVSAKGLATPTSSHRRQRSLYSRRSAGSPASVQPVPSMNSTASRRDADEPLPLDEVEDDSPHILGPAVAQDNHVLENYLSSIEVDQMARRPRPVLSGHVTSPVMFSKVQRRPLGSSDGSSYAKSKLQMIEKLLEPWQAQLIDLYFEKINCCFPIIDETSFRRQYATARDRISPAMLTCLYAHVLVCWRDDPNLLARRRHDDRYIWNLALDALYSELHFYPSSPTITAILLDVGGRPTTTLIGNGALLGAAVSLAHGLGLNRDPSSWNIPQSEKSRRMQTWWCLVICDRWSSFAHGTPPHIRASNHDVPVPGQQFLKSLPPEDVEAGQPSVIFAALATLSNVLYLCLEKIYRVQIEPNTDTSLGCLSHAMSDWVDTLGGDVRRLILRGTHLDLRGAANLRLTFLATKFLIHKVELDAQNITDAMLRLNHQNYVQARRSAEDVVLLVQELDEQQLKDFWLAIVAFIFTSTTTFLIRSAIETEIPKMGSTQSPSLALARDLIEALRSHQERYDWDLGDLCIDQYGSVVEKLFVVWPSEDQQPLAASIPLPPDMSAINVMLPDYLDNFFFEQFS